MKLLVAGLLPIGGAIRADGEPLTKCERAYKARLGYLPQDFGLFDELTVEQLVQATCRALKGLPRAAGKHSGSDRAVHLGEKRRARIPHLGGGSASEVGIAQALLGDPAFLIFDEPTVGLDPEERIRCNLFSRLAQDRLVLLSTHIIEDVQSVCSRLLVLHQGRLRFDGTPEELIRAAGRGHL